MFKYDEENDKTFKNIEEKLRISIERELLKSSLVIQSKAKLKAPVDTGNLRNHIEVEDQNLKSNLEISIVSKKPNGADEPYPIFVHNGTRKMAARPYLKSSYDEEKANLIKNLEGLLSEK